MITTTDKLEMNAAAKGQASPTPSAITQWRVSGTTSATAWKNAPTAAGNTYGAVSQVAGQSQAAGWFDTTTIVGQSDGLNVVVPERVPTLIDVRVCITLSTGQKCSGQSTVLRVPHAFGSSYPTAAAGPGQVALWTGELKLESADVDFPTPTGSIAIARTHTSFTNQGASQNRVFGPGWTASFDGDDAGFGGSELYDNTTVDGTLAVIDADGTAFVYRTPPSGTRRTSSVITAGTYLPADEDTASSGASLVVSGAGASTVVELTSDGTTTRFQVASAPVAGAIAKFKTVEVREIASSETTAYTYDANGRVSAIIAPLPDGVSSCAPGTKAKGCRVLKVSYAASTTATASIPGDYLNQISSISVQVNLDNDRILATYKYDSSGRLVQATDAQAALTTGYSWTGSGTTLRLSTVTPPGQAAYSLVYDSSVNKLARVTRPIPASAGGGTAQLAAYIYNVPLSGSGLPTLTAASVARWDQAANPAWAAAVFGPNQLIPGTATSVSAVTDSSWWQRASFQYTNADGYTINTAGWGAGNWQFTATEYGQNGNIITSWDQRNLRFILDQAIPVGAARDYATVTWYNGDIADGSGNVVTPAGALIVAKWGPTHTVYSPSGPPRPLRLMTTTTYDENAPNNGINPLTRQPYRLPTSVASYAVSPAGVWYQRPSRIRYGYSALEVGDKTGWELGKSTSTTVDMNPGQIQGYNPDNIIYRSRYDARGRMIENRQPQSGGTDAGTTQTVYYSGGVSSVTSCGNKPEYAGMPCQTGPKAQPAGQTIPTTMTTGYTWDLQALTQVETSGSVTRTTNSGYDAKNRPTTISVSVTGLSSSTALPTITTNYDSATGQVAGTSSTAGATAITYDTWGRQVTYTNSPQGQSADNATTTFNGLGQIASIVDNQGETSFTYDGLDANGLSETRGLPTAVRVKVAGGAEYSATGAYDESAALTLERLPGNINRRTTYDNAGRLVALTFNGQTTDPNTGASTADQPWLGWSQLSDALGRTMQEWTPEAAAYENRLGADGTPSHLRYTYDPASRLREAFDNTGHTVNGRNPCQYRNYGLDLNGNRISNYTTTGTAVSLADHNATCEGTTITESHNFDAADRSVSGASNSGAYVYDQLGRQTVLPATDAPNAALGDISISYYDTDAVRATSQNGTTTTFTLDGFNRRLSQATSGSTRSITRHYTNSSDNPTWTNDSDGSSTITTRYVELLGSGLGLTFTTAGGTTSVALNLGTPRGDIAATISLSQASNAPGASSVASIDSWTSYTEYGKPRQARSSVAGGVTGIGYGWLGSKQRETVDSGLTLMGARLYNPVLGQFTSPDPIPGGNATAYTYSVDPINSQDSTGSYITPNYGDYWGRRVEKIYLYALNHFYWRLGAAGAFPYWGKKASNEINTVYTVYVVYYAECNCSRIKVWKFGITKKKKFESRANVGVGLCRFRHKYCWSVEVAIVIGWYYARYVESSLISFWAQENWPWWSWRPLCPPGHLAPFKCT